MSQDYQQPPFTPYEAKPLPPRQENGVGIAGFITSVIGLITCGSLSIFGVVLSAIGLRKEPRGLAIAGLLLGFVGIVELIAVVALVFTGVRVTKNVAATVQHSIGKVQLHQSAAIIGQNWQEEDRLPSVEESEELLRGMTDIWGQEIQYESDGFGFSLRSNGPDRQANTEDDITVGPFENAESAINIPMEDPFGGEFQIEGFDELQESMQEMNREMEEEMKKALEDLENAQQQLEDAQRSLPK